MDDGDKGEDMSANANALGDEGPPKEKEPDLTLVKEEAPKGAFFNPESASRIIDGAALLRGLMEEAGLIPEEDREEISERINHAALYYQTNFFADTDTGPSFITELNEKLYDETLIYEDNELLQILVKTRSEVQNRRFPAQAIATVMQADRIARIAILEHEGRLEELEN